MCHRDLCLAHYFLVYINDLYDNLASDVRLFADDISLFTVVYDETVSAQILNSDLNQKGGGGEIPPPSGFLKAALKQLNQLN